MQKHWLCPCSHYFPRPCPGLRRVRVRVRVRVSLYVRVVMPVCVAVSLILPGIRVPGRVGLSFRVRVIRRVSACVLTCPCQRQTHYAWYKCPCPCFFVTCSHCRWPCLCPYQCPRGQCVWPCSLAFPVSLSVSVSVFLSVFVSVFRYGRDVVSFRCRVDVFPCQCLYLHMSMACP